MFSGGIRFVNSVRKNILKFIECVFCFPSGIVVKQDIVPSVEGKANFQLLAEYYNRRLSGWEPCLEPWR